MVMTTTDKKKEVTEKWLSRVVHRLSFFLRLAISVQPTLAVSGKGRASADILFGQIRELAQNAVTVHVKSDRSTLAQLAFLGGPIRTASETPRLIV